MPNKLCTPPFKPAIDAHLTSSKFVSCWYYAWNLIRQFRSLISWLSKARRIRLPSSAFSIMARGRQLFPDVNQKIESLTLNGGIWHRNRSKKVIKMHIDKSNSRYYLHGLLQGIHTNRICIYIEFSGSAAFELHIRRI